MIYRHLDYPPDTPVEELGDAALDDLIGRGDLADWQPLARAISQDPNGSLADRVLRLCAANPRYGTSALWRSWIRQRRQLAQVPHEPVVTLAMLRRRRHLTQTALAARLGTSQSDLSKAERRPDWKVSTLASIVGALGYRLRLIVEDSEGRAVGEIRPAP